MVNPRLGDISSTKTGFIAGDRVIARVNQPLTREQKKKILSGIDKYAGVALNALIVDCSTIELIRDRSLTRVCLAGRHHYSSRSGREIQFGCSKIDFEAGDIFYLAIKWQDPKLRNSIKNEISRWIGAHEIIEIPWTA